MMARTVILLTAGICVGLYYLLIAVPDCATWCMQMHERIITGTADSPWNYRILVPAMLAPFTGANIVQFTTAYAAYHLIIIPTLFVVFDAWLRKWVSRDRALIGVLLLAVLFTSMYYFSYNIAAYSPMEAMLLCLALLIAHQQKPMPFAALVVLATLNRETGILLPLIYVAINLDTLKQRARLIWAIVYFALWGIVFGALRLLHPAPGQVDLAFIQSINHDKWVDILIVNLPLLGIWGLVISRLRNAPSTLRALAVVALLYLGVVIAFGVWREARLLLPLLILLLPLALIDKHNL